MKAGDKVTVIMKSGNDRSWQDTIWTVVHLNDTHIELCDLSSTHRHSRSIILVIAEYNISLWKDTSITFKEMLDKIEEYQCLLSPDVRTQSDQEKLNRARICSLALYQEVGELVDSFPFKPWREVEDQPLDIENMKREAIDIIFFLAQITRCFGITSADLEDQFFKVLANNTERLTNGYSKISTEDDKNVKE